MRENAFKQKEKKPELKFNPGLELIGLLTTGRLSGVSQTRQHCAKESTIRWCSVYMKWLVIAKES